jgi:hypothetical protein
MEHVRMRMHAEPIFMVNPIIMSDHWSFYCMYVNCGSHFRFHCMRAKIGWFHKYIIDPTTIQLESVYDIC